MNIKLGLGAALLGMSMLVGGTASAATMVTQLIHFDDIQGNGGTSYTTMDGNFLFTPTNFQSGNCADSTTNGNGSCVIEAGAQGQRQGELPLMTRLTGDKLFSLDSFYFFFSGNGTGNSITVTSSAAAPNNFKTFALGTTYTNIFDYATGLLVTGNLVHNTAYIADMSSFTEFDNIVSVKFSASEDAQVRIDCVVATFDGVTDEPLSGFKKGCGIEEDNGGGGGIGNVPLPAGMPLMLAGLGAFAFLARRKARKA